VICTITPLGEGARIDRTPVVMYCATAAWTAACVGLAVSLLGRASALSTSTSWLVVGVLMLAYGLRELGFIRLPVPSRRWQVPAEWVSRNPVEGAIIWGVCLGSGVLVYMPYAAFYGLMAWLFVSGEALSGLLLGSAYGLGRSCPVLVRALRAGSARQSETISLYGWRGIWHQVHGLMMGALGAFLLVAKAGLSF